MAAITSRKRPDNLKLTVKQLLNYLGKHKVLLLIVSILVTLSALANLLGTYMLSPIIDNYTTDENFDKLWQPITLEITIYLIGVLSTFGYTQIMARLAQKMIKELRHDAFSHMETLPLKFFDSRTHGEIMSNYINDIDSLSDAMNNAFAMLISNAMQIMGLMVLIIVINWLLALICIAFYIIMFSYIIFASKKSKKYYSKSSLVMGELNGFVEESITGQKVVKVFNHEEANKAIFEKKNQDLKESNFIAIRYSTSMVPMVVSLSYINYAIVAILGGLIALGYIPIVTLTLGGISSFLVFVRQAALPINQFTQQSNLLLNGLAGAERIFKLLDETPEVNEGTVVLVNTKEDNGMIVETNELTHSYAWKDTNGKLIPLTGDVRFYNVDFGYNESKLILKDLSLYAKPGQKIAFVGPTGAGKTTITNLINRFYEINSGTITIDSIDIKTIEKSSLRKSLGIVLQDTHLFSGTIEENIKYGNLDATHEEVVEAAKLANAHSFIKRLPNGYDTYITSDGANLSQGQRQLISIARTAISKAPILILDEATSSIDTRTESLVENGMDKLMEGKTVFVIAHRLSTVRNSNAIMVLEKGKIIERGDHDDLIKQRGLYYNLATGSQELE